MSTAVSDAGIALQYACHYCGRTNGARTRDHKIPRLYGGKSLVGNVVRCCMMCNMIKSSRPYGFFLPLLNEFLEEHGVEYRAADPDDRKCISAMARKFRNWLKTQHCNAAE